MGGYELHDKTAANGRGYYQCKDRKLYTPSCKGRLVVLGDNVLKESPHCHPPSLKDVGVNKFLSGIRRNNTNETPANVVREQLVDAPDAVKTGLPTMYNMKETIRDFFLRES